MGGHAAHAPMEAICAHVERHLGPIESAFHEIVSDAIHVDVHVVPPTEDRPCVTLFTTGMSALPMTAPEGAEEWRFAEVLIHLPPDWPLLQEDFADPNHYWPIRLLKQLARFPHETKSWLGPGHTIGEETTVYGDRTPFTGAILLPPDDEEFAALRVEGETIRFFEVVPLFPEEQRLKIDHGLDAILAAFSRHQLSPIVTPERTNVVTGAAGPTRTLRRPRPFGLVRQAPRRFARPAILAAAALLAASAVAVDLVLPLAYGLRVRVAPLLITATLLMPLVCGRAWARWVMAALCAASFVLPQPARAGLPDAAWATFVGTSIARALAFALLVLPPWRGK